MERDIEQFVVENLVPIPRTRYRLLNKKDSRFLEHPLVGLWGTSDINEALDYLKACHEWLEADGLGDLACDYVVWDEYTQEIV